MLLLHDAPLTLREYTMADGPSLAELFREIAAYLTGRDDAVVFGAHGVNAYVDAARMTQDIDILATDAEGLAEALRQRLAERFHIAARVREVAGGRGRRVYQVMKPSNRHLVDVRQVECLPSARRIGGLLVATPEELLAMKVISHVARAGQPKSTTDLADIQRLLLAFPEKAEADGEVAELLRRREAPARVLERWAEIVAAPLLPEDLDDEAW